MSNFDFRYSYTFEARGNASELDKLDAAMNEAGMLLHLELFDEMAVDANGMGGRTYFTRDDIGAESKWEELSDIMVNLAAKFKDITFIVTERFETGDISMGGDEFPTTVEATYENGCFVGNRTSRWLEPYEDSDIPTIKHCMQVLKDAGMDAAAELLYALQFK